MNPTWSLRGFAEQLLPEDYECGTRGEVAFCIVHYTISNDEQF